MQLNSNDGYNSCGSNMIGEIRPTKRKNTRRLDKEKKLLSIDLDDLKQKSDEQRIVPNQFNIKVNFDVPSN